MSIRHRARRMKGKVVTSPPPSITFTLRDDFSTDAAAPLSSPRNAEPTGTLTLVQTDGQFSIANGALNVPAQSTPVMGDLGFYGAAVTALGGRALLAKFTPTALGASGWGIGWKSTANASFDSGDRYGLQFASTTVLRAYFGATGLHTVGGCSTAEHRVALVMQPNGLTYYVRGGVYSAWALVWQHNVTLPATLYAAFMNMNNAGIIDTVRVTTLSGAFAQDRGFAVVNAATAANNTDYAAVSACIIDLTITAPGTLAGSAGFQWRRVDANNYHYVGFTSTGALRAYKMVDGVLTEYGTTVNHTGVITGGATRTIRIIVSAASLIRWNDWNGTTWTQRGSTQTDSAFNSAVTVRPVMESAWSSGGGSLGALVAHPVTAYEYGALDTYL
jgi:hypothetical protein